MGAVRMSKRELNRIDVLARRDGRRRMTLAAADSDAGHPAAAPDHFHDET